MNRRISSALSLPSSPISRTVRRPISASRSRARGARGCRAPCEAPATSMMPARMRATGFRPRFSESRRMVRAALSCTRIIGLGIGPVRPGDEDAELVHLGRGLGVHPDRLDVALHEDQVGLAQVAVAAHLGDADLPGLARDLWEVGRAAAEPQTSPAAGDDVRQGGFGLRWPVAGAAALAARVLGPALGHVSRSWRGSRRARPGGDGAHHQRRHAVAEPGPGLAVGAGEDVVGRERADRLELVERELAPRAVRQTSS